MAEELESLDFVFCGWRESRGRLLMAVTPLRDGVMQETSYFSTKSKRRWVIGGIYTGAEFGESSARGLDQARYTSKWEDQGDIIQWQAVSDKAESIVRGQKVEADARKRNEIEAVMLPLRKQYAALLKQRDRAGLAALEEAALRALRAPVRATESNE